MRVGLAGPISTAPLLPWLDAGRSGTQPIPAGIGGGVPVTQLAAGLLERGHEVVIATLDLGLEQEIVVRGDRLKIHFGPYRLGRRARDGFRPERAHIRRVLASQQPELAHAHWTYEYALGALASGVRTLITVHDWAPTVFRLRPIPYRGVRMLMSYAALARGRHFTTVSPYLGDRVRRWTAEPVPVIPNGVLDDEFHHGHRTLNERRPMLTAVNRAFGARKNVHTLLRAFQLVRAWNPRCRLRLVGEEYGARGSARIWAADHGLLDGVEWYGGADHSRIAALAREADVFAHPALEESFGMVLIEAMAQGTPVVAGERSGAVPWVLDGGAAGVLTDVTSPRRLADAIIGLLSDGDRWAHCSRAGLLNAWNRFRLSAVIDRYVEVYERLAGKQLPSG